MNEDQDGEWILYDDHAAALAFKNAHIVRMREALRGAARSPSGAGRGSCAECGACFPYSHQGGCEIGACIWCEESGEALAWLKQREQKAFAFGFRSAFEPAEKRLEQQKREAVREALTKVVNRATAYARMDKSLGYADWLRQEVHVDLDALTEKEP